MKKLVSKFNMDERTKKIVKLVKDSIKLWRINGRSSKAAKMEYNLKKWMEFGFGPDKLLEIYYQIRG